MLLFRLPGRCLAARLFLFTQPRASALGWYARPDGWREDAIDQTFVFTMGERADGSPTFTIQEPGAGASPGVGFVAVFAKRSSSYYRQD